MDKISASRFFCLLEDLRNNLKHERLAEVFRVISFQANEAYGPHTHLRLEINYVKKGSCILSLPGECFYFQEGEIMIIDSNVEHLFEAGKAGTTLLQLEFLPEIFYAFLQEEAEGKTAASFPVFSHHNRLIKIGNNVRIMRVIQRIINELDAQKLYYESLVILYYAELLMLIYRYLEEVFVPIGANENLKYAIDYLRKHYRENIKMAEVAQSLDISERYLRKLFMQTLQLSPLDYLNQLRVNKAIELMKNTELSLKEIGFACGFNSSQHFCRVFKQQVGINPRDFRE